MARASTPALSPRAGRRGARAAATVDADGAGTAAAAAATSPSPSALRGGSIGHQRHQWRTSLKRLAAVVAAARLAFLLLTFVVARLLPDYDTSAELASGDCAADWPLRAAAEARARASSSCSFSAWLPPPSPSSWGVVWDAAFYHRIAACGYEYEQFAAFFPGLPWVAGRLAARVVVGAGAGAGAGAGLLPLPPRAFAVAAVLVNNAAFVVAAVLLAHLGRAVLGGRGAEEEDDDDGGGKGRRQQHQQRAATAIERLSLSAALLFGLQPAAIFTAIPYTESLFSLLTFAALCCLYCGGRGGLKGRLPRLGVLFRFEAAALLFCLAACMRSNGGVNAAFLLHEAAVTALLGLQRAWQERRGPGPLGRAAASAIILAARSCLCAAAVLAPYVLFQKHVAAIFCNCAPVRPMADAGEAAAAAATTTAATTPPPSLDRPSWCDSAGGSLLRIRSSYSHVQARYWGVGPLAYWRREQLPNFLLALPVLALTAWGALALYLGALPGTLLTGGLLPFEWERKVVEFWKGLRQGGSGRRRGAPSPPPPPPAFSSSRRAAVFVVQWSALALFAALTMNVQVSTRMLCASCPALYWAAAEMAGLGGQEGGEGKQRGPSPPPPRRRTAATLLWVYCFGFALAGAVLNPQFLPWT